MIIHSKNLIVNTEDFPAIYITRSNVNCDKYSVVFQSKLDANANVSITDLEYSKAAEILSDISKAIINNKFNLKIENIENSN